MVAHVREDLIHDSRSAGGAERRHGRPADIQIAEETLRIRRRRPDEGCRRRCRRIAPDRVSPQGVFTAAVDHHAAAQGARSHVRAGFERDRLCGGDDVTVDRGAHLHALPHPVLLEPRRGGQEVVPGQKPSLEALVARVERLHPAVGDERVEGRRAPVEGSAGCRNPQDRRLLRGEVDTAVVRRPHERDGAAGVRRAEEVPVPPVERCRGRTGTCAGKEHGGNGDAPHDRCSRRETVTAGHAGNRQGPENREERKRSHGDGVAGWIDGRGNPDSGSTDRRCGKRPAGRRGSDADGKEGTEEHDQHVELFVPGDGERCRDRARIREAAIQHSSQSCRGCSHEDDGGPAEDRECHCAARSRVLRYCDEQGSCDDCNEGERPCPALERRPGEHDRRHGRRRGRESSYGTSRHSATSPQR